MQKTGHFQEAVCQQWVRLGSWHGRRAGLRAEDLEDCTMEFVARMLQHPEDPRLASPLFLHQKARQHVSNYSRRQKRRGHRELAFSFEEELPPDAVLWSSPSSLPEHQVLKQEFWRRLDGALHALKELPCTLFLAYYGEGLPMSTLTQETGKSVHAIQQSLLRSRRRLRHQLEQQGHTSADLSALLPCY